MDLYKHNNQNLEFVWFFGSSAVGKETLIKELVQGNINLAKKLSLIGKPKIYDKSLELRRGTLDPQHISSFGAAGDSLLIKVQWEDIAIDEGKNIPLDLKNLRPESKHKIVLLYADKATQNTHYEIRDKKEVWNYKDTFIYEFIRHHGRGMYGIAKLLKAYGLDVLYVKVLHNNYGFMNEKELEKVVDGFRKEAA